MEQPADEGWASREVQDAFETISTQLEQLRVKTARITSTPGYEPQEVWIIYESLDRLEQRQHTRARGLVSRSKHWMLMSTEQDKDWKYLSHVFSEDCKICAFVSESIEMGHSRDVIQVESVVYNKAMFVVNLGKDKLHGPVIMSGPQSHFKISRESNRKILYFARPSEKQLHTKNKRFRLFVICVFHFDTNGITVITDENLCEHTIDAVEWTPDGRGIIFHRGKEILWHRFGEQYINQIATNVPTPLRITFSPDESRLAVFLPTSSYSNKAILLFHWPFVKAAVKIKHDIITLNNYRVWSVPERPWSHGGKQLLFNANWQNQVDNIVLRVDSLDISILYIKRPAVIVDVRENEILLETTAANTFSRLWACQLTLETNISLTAVLLATNKPDNEAMHNFNIYPLTFQKSSYSGVLYMPSESVSPGKKIPLVIVPHAGEKPNFTTSTIDPIYSTMVTCGFCVLIVNYREPYVKGTGSTFPKRFASECIDDVHSAVKETLEKHGGRIDDKYICLYGYQFGSFVACTLIIEHPTYYKCCAVVHPVLEFPSGTAYDENGVQKAAFPKDVEPVRNAGKITTPMLFVMDKKINQKYRNFENTLLHNNIPCFEEFEEEDEQYNDFVVKVIQFFKAPYDEGIKDDEADSAAID